MTKILLMAPHSHGVREEAKTVSFPAQTVATESHVALPTRTPRQQPRAEQSPTFLLSPERGEDLAATTAHGAASGEGKPRVHGASFKTP